MPRYLVQKTDGTLEILEGTLPLDLKPLLGGEVIDISTLSVAETVDLRVAPTITASSSVTGRTVTITVDSTTGDPAPATALTSLTLDGVDVSADATGSGPWDYAVPDKTAAQTVAWTVSASNSLSTATSSGSESVAAQVTWTLESLFSSGEQVIVYDPSDLSTLYQDSAGTTAVTADGDPVGYMGDKSGNGNHATQSTSAARPVYRTDGTLHWLEFDGVDDGLRTANGVLNTSTVTTVCGVNTGGNRGTVWGFPHEANNHTSPYFRFSLFRIDSFGTDIRVNDSNDNTNNIPSGDNVFYVSSSDTEMRVNANVKSTTIPAALLTYPNIVPLLIGQNAVGGETLSGKFYGFFGVNRSLTSIEIGEVETYMAEKVGVTL